MPLQAKLPFKHCTLLLSGSQFEGHLPTRSPLYTLPPFLCWLHQWFAEVYTVTVVCCAVFELWTGKAAFAGLSKVQVMVGVVSSGLRPVFPLHCPAWYSSLAAACWMQSADSRLASPLQSLTHVLV